MWGDPERAATLRGNDPLATLLFQIGSPAHIPWGDPRWQEVLHGYDVWVHADADSNPLVGQACQSIARHAATSSNLAALSLHVTRMLREMVHDIRRPPTTANEATTTATGPAAAAATTATATGGVGKAATITASGATHSSSTQVTDFSKRISRVAKARATAGALQLLRLLCHPVVVRASQEPETSVNSFKEAFIYHTRGDLPNDQPAGFPLVHSILDLVAVVGTDPSVLHTSEVYDTVVFAIQLLFVLCGTQLYQPFQSSFERTTPLHYILEEIFRPEDDDETIDDNNLQSLWSSKSSMASGSNKAAGATSKNGRGGDRGGKKRGKRRVWTPQLVLETCLAWQLNRPDAPERSICRYYYMLAQSAVGGRGGEKTGPDGMYESHMVVQATAPISTVPAGSDASNGSMATASLALSTNRYSPGEPRHNIIVDATRGVLTLSGTIILLPFRLMRLVFGVFIANKNRSQGSNDAAMMRRFVSGASGNSSRTRDTLWLSDSILADLGCSLLLLLLNNNRNGEHSNQFRGQVKGLTDDRWVYSYNGGGLPDLPNFNGIDSQASFKLLDFGNEEQQEQHRSSLSTSSVIEEHALTLNFESLFISFGRTLHTEIGALFLYTLIQSSVTFAESLVVRSDLDTLVMPLLRTLYFASRTNTYMAKDYASTRQAQGTSSVVAMDIRSCPFRSQSQLYVIVILLLLFSQDASFGRDAFRRISVPAVVWYKERHLKNINLGSIMVLTLLRSLLFNLHRLHDSFLLSNCCAVIMNMSPAVVDLHEYASMRLVAVTVTVMKKHLKLATSEPLTNHSNSDANISDSNGHDVDGNDNDSSPKAMHEEVARTLLGVIKNCLSPQNVEQNLQLIYALVYHQVDLMKLCKASIVGSSGRKKSLYPSRLIQRIQSVTLEASAFIQQAGARSAPKALKVLETQMSLLKAASINAETRATNRSPSKRRPKPNDDSPDTNVNESGVGSLELPPSEEEFTFTYEEEADPEIFFLPYVWEVIVCVVTSGTMDWKKDEIRAFALLDEVDIDDDDDNDDDDDDAGGISAIDLALGTGVYTTDADDRV